MAPGIEGRDNVRMHHPPLRTDLRIKPIDRLSVGRKALRKNLHGNLTVHRPMTGTVDLTHATGPQTVQDDVFA
jgi:hypothetical protein